MLIIAQVLGLIAVGLYLFSYQLKKRKHIVLITSFSNSIYVLQYLLLGAFSGAVMDVLSAVASFLATKKNNPCFRKYEKLVSISSVIVIILIGIIIARIADNAIELLPIGGAVFQVISLWCNNEQMLRKFGLCSAPFWLIYNIITKAYGAAFGSLLAIISIIVSLIRFKQNKKS